MAQPLKNMRILVVEDDYLVATAIADELTSRGAMVIGPVATVDDALEAVVTAEADMAVLDIRLRQELVFPLADYLAERGIPYLFQSGCDDVPLRYARAPRWIKPYLPTALASSLSALVAPSIQ